jgi:hypothetical protein
MYGNGAQIGIGLTITKKAQYQIPLAPHQAMTLMSQVLPNVLCVVGHFYVMMDIVLVTVIPLA